MKWNFECEAASNECVHLPRLERRSISTSKKRTIEVRALKYFPGDTNFEKYFIRLLLETMFCASEIEMRT
jgi:hypothetical protein